MTFRIEPDFHAARIAAAVPATLAIVSSTTNSNEERMATRAARWNKTSQPLTASSHATGSSRSPTTSRAPLGTLHRRPTERLSRMVTSEPSSSNRRAIREPMKPAPPVIQAFRKREDTVLVLRSPLTPAKDAGERQGQADQQECGRLRHSSGGTRGDLGQIIPDDRSAAKRFRV